jgi:hypothetical protein
MSRTHVSPWSPKVYPVRSNFEVALSYVSRRALPSVWLGALDDRRALRTSSILLSQHVQRGFLEIAKAGELLYTPTGKDSPQWLPVCRSGKLRRAC